MFVHLGSLSKAEPMQQQQVLRMHRNIIQNRDGGDIASDASRWLINFEASHLQPSIIELYTAFSLGSLTGICMKPQACAWQSILIILLSN